ncbi:MAG: LL-diaminopimelate aminotransferase [Spirochaetales bacterium]|nr:LL-diaminopimelate aminotransferase [Spirochaetales bacterium]
MIRINEDFNKLAASYLFSEVRKRVAAYTAEHPDVELVKMGIGDVTLPLPAACVAAFRRAVEEMGVEETFRGYRDDEGYEFLREKIAAADFQKRGADIDVSEIFISDGAKSDSGNIQDLFARDIVVAVPDPVYPVYVDSNVMAGRSGAFRDGRYEGFLYLDSTTANHFIPSVPAERADLIYLCFPNNPTGAVISRDALSAWVEYARRNRALIVYDAAYAAFLRDEKLPQSIFEIEGAKEVAIEIRSFSKTAGFTGTRCAYTVVPHDCVAYNGKNERVSVHDLWSRRQNTKFNGVSYPVQRAAEAVYTEEGQRECRRMNDYYLENAALIRSAFTAMGYACSGGEHSPYVWVDTGVDSWNFFTLLLEKAHVVCTPGAGFGRCGAGYVRFSAFGDRQSRQKGIENIKSALGA